MTKMQLAWIKYNGCAPGGAVVNDAKFTAREVYWYKYIEARDDKMPGFYYEYERARRIKDNERESKKSIYKEASTLH